jgi:predicted ATPase
MAQQPFLKSIRPVNLLSFGPNTEEIELRRELNILIGPNGSGKSNLIEILGLLRNLTEKKPWGHITETGGVKEWVWKDTKQRVSSNTPSRSALDVVSTVYSDEEMEYAYQIRLATYDWSTTFSIENEGIQPHPISSKRLEPHEAISRENDRVVYWPLEERGSSSDGLNSQRAQVTDQISILSLPLGIVGANALAHDLFQRIALYRNWTFGFKSSPRTLEQAGKENTYLEEESGNLAHVLNFLLTHPTPEPGQKLLEAFKKFCGDVEDIQTRVQEGFVQLRVREISGISIPAIRLSDGTLRWLALLTILLNPTPAPVTCIDEPELGLHPDVIPTLADLLVDAAKRTQLIVTTHSSALIDAFSDDPEAVCICEKVEGSTVIRRLDKNRLKVWLKDYSLGHLWASGEIGGNRW